MEADFQMDFMHPDQENSQMHSNKRMQSDFGNRYAITSAADAGRYAEK